MHFLIFCRKKNNIHILIVKITRSGQNMIFIGIEILFSDATAVRFGTYAVLKKGKLRYRVKEALFLINVYSEKG